MSGWILTGTCGTWRGFRCSAWLPKPDSIDCSSAIAAEYSRRLDDGNSVRCAARRGLCAPCGRWNGREGHMPTRRGHGEGSIAQRADGRWMGRLDSGRGIDGRRRRKTVYGATERDVVQAMKALHGRDAQGLVVSTSTPTVAAFLAQWFATNCDTWKPSTRLSDQGAIDGHLVPPFGPLRLEQLTPSVIQSWLVAAKTQYGARRRIELAHATLRFRTQ